MNLTPGPSKAGPDMASPDMAGPDMAGPDMAGLGIAGLRRLRCLILVLSIASILPLAACGKKAPPQAPPDQKKVYPRTYPYDPTAKPPGSDEESQ